MQLNIYKLNPTKNKQRYNCFRKTCPTLQKNWLPVLASASSVEWKPLAACECEALFQSVN